MKHTLYKTSLGGCLKFYRDQDQIELSISFEGAEKVYTKTYRTEMCFFLKSNSASSSLTICGPSTEEMLDIINAFRDGKSLESIKELYYNNI